MSHSAGAGPILRLRPVKSPDPALPVRNLAAVSPHDIPPSRDGRSFPVIVNNQFVFSAINTVKVEPGSIGLFDDQRTWAGISFADEVTVQRYVAPQGAPQYLETIDLEIAFRGKRTTERLYKHDELEMRIRDLFTGQYFAPTQKMILDVEGVALSLDVVATVLRGSTASNMTAAPESRGVLTPDTGIAIWKRKGSPMKFEGSKRQMKGNHLFKPNWNMEQMGVGGLDDEFMTLFRRAFASRLVPPGLAQKMGLQHVKGILLYGPPGTGKTLIARKIGQFLNAKEPKVINGPEVLNKFVGQSEENIRKLFLDAEEDEKNLGEDSQLHVIIFDELDAVCRQRGSGAAGGTGVGDSVVNQLLTKLDGVHQLNNILLIGMTNRKDMIDDALLRPGRLELHIEISLPDEPGRVQIFNIHLSRLRKEDVLGTDVNIAELAARTKNFSGAEIAGLIRAAQSFAFMRYTKDGDIATLSPEIEHLKLSRQDFMSALEEVRPAFGVSEESLSTRMVGGIIRFSPIINTIIEEANQHVRAVRAGDAITRTDAVLFHGPSGSGKTALAAYCALASQFPMVRLVTAEDLIGMSDAAKIAHLTKAFEDGYKSPLCLLVIDNLERLIEWNPIGLRFNNTMLTALSVCMSKSPPSGRRMLIFATTSRYSALEQLDFMNNFSSHIPVPAVDTINDLYNVLEDVKFGSDIETTVEKTMEILNGNVGLGIHGVLQAIGQARTMGSSAEVLATAIMNNPNRVLRH